MESVSAFEVAGFLALAANRIVEAVKKPIEKKFPELDMWWLIYPTWILGGVLSWLAGVDLFASLFVEPMPLVSKGITALVVGGGSNLLAALFSTKKK